MNRMTLAPPLLLPPPALPVGPVAAAAAAAAARRPLRASATESTSSASSVGSRHLSAPTTNCCVSREGVTRSRGGLLSPRLLVAAALSLAAPPSFWPSPWPSSSSSSSSSPSAPAASDTPPAAADAAAADASSSVAVSPSARTDAARPRTRAESVADSRKVVQPAGALALLAARCAARAPRSAATTCAICGPKPRSISRSASSSTSQRSPARAGAPSATVVRRWSSRRPGVATSSDTPLRRRAFSALRFSPPATSPGTRNGNGWHSRDATVKICWHNSRVGAMMMANSPELRESPPPAPPAPAAACCCSASSACRIGARNAIVLPLPVSLLAHSERPASAGGMNRRCTRVGRDSPKPSREWPRLTAVPTPADAAAAAGSASAVPPSAAPTACVAAVSLPTRRVSSPRPLKASQPSQPATSSLGAGGSSRAATLAASAAAGVVAGGAVGARGAAAGAAAAAGLAVCCCCGGAERGGSLDVTTPAVGRDAPRRAPLAAPA